KHHLDPNCKYDEVWVDSSKGILCRGLPGPNCWIDNDFFEFKNIPSDIELLQDDICIRFLASLKSKDVDEAVVWAISWDGGRKELNHYGRPNVYQPTLFLISTNATIAVGTVKWSIMGGFKDREVMENGESRFTLHRKEGSLHSFELNNTADHAWLSQALSVFHALGISLDSDLSDFELIAPRAYLCGYLSDRQEARQRCCQQPIYLFVHPPDLTTSTEYCTTSSFHYWSFDPTGQPPLSTTTCSLLGLPLELYLRVFPPTKSSWTNTAYKRIHDYQIARGFDPTTPDFARSLRYSIFQVQHDSHRFEEVADATAASSTTFPAVTPPKEVPSKPSTIDSNPILSTPICPDPALEASYTVFASNSSSISPESTSNSWLGDCSPDHSQRNTQLLPLPHSVLTPFNDRHLHAAGTSPAAYTTPIHPHTSLAGLDFLFGATYPNDYTGWNPNLLWSGLPYGQFHALPPPVPSLGPPVASSLPFISYPNTSGALQGWKTTDTPSLKWTERVGFYPNAFFRGNTKHARLLETSESDATWSLWPAQEAECGASSGNLEGGVAADVRGMQTYGSSEGMGRPVTQTNEPEDEIRRLREENERLRRMLEISGSKNVA
ncbi:hypothetical protein V5O48_016442, partial [Marasmius crinis-equi]